MYCTCMSAIIVELMYSFLLCIAKKTQEVLQFGNQQNRQADTRNYARAEKRREWQQTIITIILILYLPQQSCIVLPEVSIVNAAMQYNIYVCLFTCMLLPFFRGTWSPRPRTGTRSEQRPWTLSPGGQTRKDRRPLLQPRY